MGWSVPYMGGVQLWGSPKGMGVAVGGSMGLWILGFWCGTVSADPCDGRGRLAIGRVR